MPNGTDWPVVAFGAGRAGATLVPLSTLLRPPELEAQLRTAGVEHLVLVPGFLGSRLPRRPRGDLAAPRDPAPGCSSRSCRDCGRSPPGTRDRRRPTTAYRADLVDALDAAVRPADDLAVIFTSGSRGTPKGVIHTHGGALGATAAGLDARRLGRDDRLYIPMPFFWVGGFGTGLLSALVAGATLLTEAQPEPGGDPALPRTRAGHPVPGLARPGGRTRARRRLRDRRPRVAASRAASTRSSRRELQAPPGTRANLLGMTESFGPYSGDRLDRTLPPGKEGSCGRPFAGVEVRIADVETGAPITDGSAGEIQLRGPEPDARDLRAAPVGDLHRRRLLPDRRPRAASTTTGTSSSPAGATTCSRSAARRCTRARSRRRCARSTASARCTWSTSSATAPSRSPRSSLATAARSRSTTSRARRRARLSAFKVPQHWRVVGHDDVPRTSTGKVDKAGLQQLFE